MTADTARQLKENLYEAYGGFADKRRKNIDNGNLFIIDDRSPADEDATGHLFLWFCQIFAEVLDGETIKITMRGGIPQSSGVAKWLSTHNAEHSNGGLHFLVRKGEEDDLSELALHFRAIVRPGARYSVKSYKYICPRVAASVKKLQAVLQSVWNGA